MNHILYLLAFPLSVLVVLDAEVVSSKFPRLHHQIEDRLRRLTVPPNNYVGVHVAFACNIQLTNFYRRQ